MAAVNVKCVASGTFVDAAGCYQLARDESMRDGSLYRGRGRCRGAAAGSGQTGCAGDVRKLRGARSGDDRKRTVVAADADTRDGYGLPGRETVRGRRSDGDEKTVFRRAVGAGGDRDRGWLRCAIRAGRDGNDYVFVEDRWPCAGAALADAIEIRVVELARQIVARFSVADGQVFSAKEGRGICVGIRSEATGDGGKSSWRSFFVENAVGIQQHRAQRGVQRFVGLDVIDSRIPSERPEKRLQPGPRGHAAIAENHVLAVGRDSMRQIRRRHVCHQAAENLDGRIK